MRDAYGKALVALGEANDDIVVLSADLSESTRVLEFGKRFPERFFNMGVAEQDMIGTASGLALGGKIPFVSTFAIFATGRPWEQVRQSVCLCNRNVKIVATHGGITVGADGASHQALEDIAIMRVLPRMTVIVPADAAETAAATRVIASHVGPVYMRLPRGKSPVVYSDKPSFRIGKSTLLRSGRDVTIIATGIMVSEALEAATLLEQEDGLEVGVINMSTIKPLDVDAVLMAASGTGAVVTVEEHTVIGGLGSAVAEVLGENMPVPFKRIGVEDSFGVSGSPGELLARFGLCSDNIARWVRDVVKRK